MINRNTIFIQSLPKIDKNNTSKALSLGLNTNDNIVCNGDNDMIEECIHCINIRNVVNVSQKLANNTKFNIDNIGQYDLKMIQNDFHHIIQNHDENGYDVLYKIL